MTRTEHIAWCKARALEYVEMGDLDQALASFASDISKHPETNTRAADLLIGDAIISGRHRTPETMRAFIEGFN